MAAEYALSSLLLWYIDTRIRSFLINSHFGENSMFDEKCLRVYLKGISMRPSKLTLIVLAGARKLRLDFYGERLSMDLSDIRLCELTICK